MKKILTKAAQGAGLIFFGMIISKLLHYLYRIIIARMLSPSDYGLIILGMSIVSIGGWIALFGLNQAAERNVSYYYDKKEKLKGIVISIIKFAIPLSIFIAFLVFFLSEEISLLIRKENLIEILKILSFGVIGYSLSEITNSTLRGLKKIKEYMYVKNIIEPLSRVMFTFAFILLGFKIKGVAVAYVLSLFISVIIGVVIIKKNLPIIKDKIKAINMDKEILSFSWPLLFTGIVFSITGWIDTIMIAYFSTEELVGIYNIALPTAGMILISQSAFDGIFIPIMSSLYSKKKYFDMRMVYESVTKWITIITIPLFLVIILFSKGIINILFGSQYLDAIIPTIILSVGFLFAMLVGPCESMLNVLSKTKVKMFLRILMLIINILLNIILIPRYGIIGAAIATTIALIFYNAVSLIYLKRKLSIKILKAKTFLLLILGFVVPYIISISYNQLNRLLTFALIFLSLVYILLILFLVKYLDNEDISIIYDIEEKLNINSHIFTSVLKKFSRDQEFK